jgi:hypothetical protein
MESVKKTAETYWTEFKNTWSSFLQDTQVSNHDLQEMNTLDERIRNTFIHRKTSTTNTTNTTNTSKQPSTNNTTEEEGFANTSDMSTEAFEEYQEMQLKRTEIFALVKEAESQEKSSTNKVTTLGNTEYSIQEKLKTLKANAETFVSSPNSTIDENNRKYDRTTQEGFSSTTTDTNDFAIPTEADVKNMSEDKLLYQLGNVREAKRKAQSTLTAVAETKVTLDKELESLEITIKQFEERHGLTAGNIFDNFLSYCDPPIHIDKNNLPKDPLTWTYIIVLIIFNIPVVFTKSVAHLSFQTLTGKDSTLATSSTDVELIRKFLVEFCYIFLTFWLTFIVLKFAINPAILKPLGPITKFNYIEISMFKDIAQILYYPSQLFISILTENIVYSLEYVRVEPYKPLTFMWVFFVALYFVYNYMGTFRDSFFASFLTRDQFPKASGIVNFLLVIKYLLRYFGTSAVNAVMWFTGPITRIIQFIFVVILVHSMAGIAQFGIAMCVFIYLMGPFFIQTGGIQDIPKIYTLYSGVPPRSCDTIPSSFMAKLNHFIGLYVIHEIKEKSSIKQSTFLFLVFLLFFIYRMVQIENASEPMIRITTGIFNSIGIAICVICIYLIHFSSGRKLQIGSQNEYHIDVPVVPVVPATVASAVGAARPILPTTTSTPAPATKAK